MDQENRPNAGYTAPLKKGAAAEAAAPAREPGPDQSPAKASATTAATEPKPFQGAEKRRSPRYKCEGSAEMLELNTNVQGWATFTDISLHGCYTEAHATFPVGTDLHMKLEANGYRVETKAQVRVCYPYLGMGIAFVATTDENRARLRELLSSISRPSVIVGPGIASSFRAEGTKAAPLITNPNAAIQALIDVFEKRQMVNREDFLKIIRSSQKTDGKP